LTAREATCNKVVKHGKEIVRMKRVGGGGKDVGGGGGVTVKPLPIWWGGVETIPGQ